MSHELPPSAQAAFELPPVPKRRQGRTVTILAAGFLTLDGVLLGLAGAWSGRVGLLLWGAGFIAGAIAVVFYWRRYLRQLRALNEGLVAHFRELQELERELRRD